MPSANETGAPAGVTDSVPFGNPPLSQVALSEAVSRQLAAYRRIYAYPHRTSAPQRRYTMVPFVPTPDDVMEQQKCRRALELLGASKWSNISEGEREDFLVPFPPMVKECTETEEEFAQRFAAWRADNPPPSASGGYAGRGPQVNWGNVASMFDLPNVTVT